MPELDLTILDEGDASRRRPPPDALALQGAIADSFARTATSTDCPSCTAGPGPDLGRGGQVPITDVGRVARHA